MRGAALVASTVLMAACAPQRYVLQPATPAQTAAKLQARSLDDDGLHRFVETALAHEVAWPPSQLDLKLLTLAAFYFNPDLAVARANADVAKAGIETARMRPNPVLDFSPGVPSPYLITAGLVFPIVTGGKRGYQVQMATDISSEAQLQFTELAWSVRGQLRAAMLDCLAAERNAALSQSAQQLQATRLTRMSDQLAAGEISRPEWETVRASLLEAEMTARTAESHVAPARAALAAIIGIPVNAISGRGLIWPEFDQIPSLDELTTTQIRRDAIVNRLDVRRAVAKYEIAERRLQLEIARRRPNFDIGPGYEYEERNNFFAPSIAIPLPVFNHNEGPIAEAEAQRKAAAAALVSVQAGVMAQSEQALAQYTADYQMTQTARTIAENLKQTQMPMIERTVRAGESDWFALNSVQLQSSAAEKAWVDSLFQAQTAIGRLEDAVQKPLEPGDEVPMVFPNE